VRAAWATTHQGRLQVKADRIGTCFDDDKAQSVVWHINLSPCGDKALRRATRLRKTKSRT